MQTKLTKLLGIQYPIIQGGMAWIADASLASAVSNAGGLGIISAMNADADWVRAEIKKCRTMTDKPFGVNIMLMSPHVEEVAKMVAEEKVPVVTTGAGNPSRFVKMWKEAGTVVIPVVASTALAKMVERAGVDAVIAEGMESGGHIGQITTMCLVPQVVDAVKIPVIAAGGIADGRGLAAAMMMGAEGVQCGTVFLASPECQIHPNYKEMVLGAKDTDSAITGGICVGGAPCRQVKNRYTRKVIEAERAGKPFAEIEELTIGSLRRAVQEGDKENGSFMCGQIGGMVNKIRPCAEIIQSMFDGAEKLLKNRYSEICE